MTTILDPAVPAGAYDQFLVDALPRARAQREWTPADGPLPALYLSHGAPPLFDDGPWLRSLFAWAQSLPKPKSILIVSAHWESAPPMLSAPAAHTPLVYDFGGFHPRYYTMKYETPDAGFLARRVAGALPAGQTHQHPSRGLDHGAWVPLMAMYPLADVPVLQLSMPTQDPAELLDLGARLGLLRAEGVLVIGSGFMTHGLPFITRDMIRHGTVPAWSADFDAWAADALARGDVDELAAYRNRAPGMPYAHPTIEHFAPMFLTLGASGDPEQRPEQPIDGFWLGLAKRSFVVN